MKLFIFQTACSVCFGDPTSSATKGVIAAILFLLAVVFCVLGGITATAFVWTRRAKEIGREV
ncbi:MAG: hypothetical protein ACREH5_09205 [Candidatus Omnitrophota bacterium]